MLLDLIVIKCIDLGSIYWRRVVGLFVEVVIGAKAAAVPLCTVVLIEWLVYR